MIAATQRMTPEQRLQAFVQRCQMMVELCRAGCLRRAQAAGNRVDFLIGLRGLDSGAFSRAVNLTFHGLPLRVIGLEDFIATKVYAGGPQDLADAPR